MEMRCYIPNVPNVLLKVKAMLCFCFFYSSYYAFSYRLSEIGSSHWLCWPHRSGLHLVSGVWGCCRVTEYGGSYYEAKYVRSRDLSYFLYLFRRIRIQMSTLNYIHQLLILTSTYVRRECNLKKVVNGRWSKAKAVILRSPSFWSKRWACGGDLRSSIFNLLSLLCSLDIFPIPFIFQFGFSSSDCVFLLFFSFNTVSVCLPHVSLSGLQVSTEMSPKGGARILSIATLQTFVSFFV